MYVEDDDTAMCVSAHRTFAVIFLECYKDLPPFDSMSMQGFAVAKTCVYSIKFFSNIQSKRIQSLAYILLTINEQILKLAQKRNIYGHL